MQIGDRYLNRDVLLSFIFLSIFPVGAYFFFTRNLNLNPYIVALIVLALVVLVPIILIAENRCPTCKKTLTTKILESIRISEYATKRTYFCINCGEEWTVMLYKDDRDTLT